MSWQAIARKDVRDARRSYWLWGLSAFFLLFIGGTTAFVYGVAVDPSGASSASLFGLFATGFVSFSYAGMLAFIFVFITLLTAYGSVIEERTSGSLRLLLSLPHSRLDVVVGKVVGRSAVVVVPTLGGFLLAVVVMGVLGVTIDWNSFLPEVVLSVLLLLVFASVGVAISAAAESNRRAIIGTFGTYALFTVLWGPFVRGARQLVTEVWTRVPGVADPSGAAVFKLGMFITYLNPLRIYETLVASLYFEPVRARLVKASFGEQITGTAVLSESMPFYLSDAFLFAVLLLWLVVPFALGYLLFREKDL